MLDNMPETGDGLVDDKQIRAFTVAPVVVEYLYPFSESSHDIWMRCKLDDTAGSDPWDVVAFGMLHLGRCMDGFRSLKVHTQSFEP